MDELLYKFYTRQIYIDITKASESELWTLSEILGLRWASGKELYEWRPRIHQYCFLCCAKELVLSKDHMKYKTESQILNEIQYYKDYICYTDAVSDTKVLYSIKAFIDHFRKPLKEVTEKEIEVIWG